MPERSFALELGVHSHRTVPLERPLDHVLRHAPANATPEERRKYRDLQRQKSYNVEQALISVGSGGLTGKGWRQGTQNALGFLPRGVAHNDFIFSVLAEEFGFAGILAVLGVYALNRFCHVMLAKPGGTLILTTENYLNIWGLYRVYCTLRGRTYTAKTGYTYGLRGTPTTYQLEE